MDFEKAKATPFNVPNFLSCCRLGLVPVLCYLAWNGQARLFLACFIASLATDFLDGLLARALNQATALGSKLDSRADLATTLALALCAWWLWPEIVHRERVFVIAGLGAYCGAVVFGFLKFHRLTSYHTWAGKVAAVAICIAAPLLLTGAAAWPFECATPLFVLASLEEIAMTVILPECRANVPSFWHALKLRQQSQSGDSTPE